MTISNLFCIIITIGGIQYRIIGDNRNYTNDWESSGVYEGLELSIDNFEFNLKSFEDGYDYYAVFKIYDTNNEKYYSNLVKMN